MILMGVELLISPANTIPGAFGVPIAQQVTYVLGSLLLFYFMLKYRMKRVSARRRLKPLIESDRLSILGETMCMTV